MSTRTARFVRTTRLTAGAALLLGAAALSSGCTCTTCSATGCAHPNYGKKSPSMLHAVFTPQSPASGGTATAKAIASGAAAHGG